MSRTINIAKDVGFCAGVRKAVDTAKQAASASGEVLMLGNIVHNETVVRELEQLGVHVVGSLDEVAPDKPVLFRAHGTPREVAEIARQRNLKIIDATCPLVLEIHRTVKEMEAEKRRIIIIGDHGHEEVEAIASQVAEAIVISGPQEACAFSKCRRAGVVAQSTQALGNVSEVIRILLEKVDDLRFVNTICHPTRHRQAQIQELADSNDVMIIVGSFSSANTGRLTEIASRINPRTYQISGPAELKASWFSDAQSVGIAAGASTPQEIVAETAKKINQFPG